jgi:hypothetical protein
VLTDCDGVTLIHLAVLQTIALPFADPVNASISSPISSARIIQDPVLVGTATECFAVHSVQLGEKRSFWVLTNP